MVRTVEVVVVAGASVASVVVVVVPFGVAYE